MRREWIFSAALVLFGCDGDPGPQGSTGGGGAGTGGSADAGIPDATAPALELLAVVDLPRMETTQGLSGTWFDAATHTLFAIQDLAPRLVPFTVSDDLHTFTPGDPIDLTGRPDTAWDGEAVVRLGDELVAVTVETAPLVERFDATGHYLGAIEIPALFSQQTSNNKGLESLARSPSGNSLFTVNEAALTIDGPQPSKKVGTTVRILRRALDSVQDEQRAYRTEPLGEGTGGDVGVSDLLALSDTELLVLERGFQSDYGNTVRIFRVDFAAPGAVDVSAVASLDATTPVLEKTLVVDIGALPASGATHPGIEPNPLLDNFEALALGPTLADGRRAIFVTSDDNASATQVPRILVLAVPGL
ncbi:Hypothetical protein A7982_04939 [Minicystis rosea]|nr:Hypothetical protein A7982_04939 [Minicystis rosea]